MPATTSTPPPSAEQISAAIEGDDFVLLNLTSEERVELGGQLRELALKHLDPSGKVARGVEQMGSARLEDLQLFERALYEMRGAVSSRLEALAERPAWPTDLHQVFYATSSAKGATFQATCEFLGVDPTEAIAAVTAKRSAA